MNYESYSRRIQEIYFSTDLCRGIADAWKEYTGSFYTSHEWKRQQSPCYIAMERMRRGLNGTVSKDYCIASTDWTFGISANGARLGFAPTCIIESPDFAQAHQLVSYIFIYPENKEETVRLLVPHFFYKTDSRNGEYDYKEYAGPVYFKRLGRSVECVYKGDSFDQRLCFVWGRNFFELLDNAYMHLDYAKKN